MAALHCRAASPRSIARPQRARQANTPCAWHSPVASAACTSIQTPAPRSAQAGAAGPLFLSPPERRGKSPLGRLGWHSVLHRASQDGGARWRVASRPLARHPLRMRGTGGARCRRTYVREPLRELLHDGAQLAHEIERLQVGKGRPVRRRTAVRMAECMRAPALAPLGPTAAVDATALLFQKRSSRLKSARPTQTHPGFRARAEETHHSAKPSAASSAHRDRHPPSTREQQREAAGRERERDTDTHTDTHTHRCNHHQRPLRPARTSSSSVFSRVSSSSTARASAPSAAAPSPALPLSRGALTNDRGRPPSAGARRSPGALSAALGGAFGCCGDADVGCTRASCRRRCGERVSRRPSPSAGRAFASGALLAAAASPTRPPRLRPTPSMLRETRAWARLPQGGGRKGAQRGLGERGRERERRVACERERKRKDPRWESGC